MRAIKTRAKWKQYATIRDWRAVPLFEYNLLTVSLVPPGPFQENTAHGAGADVTGGIAHVEDAGGLALEVRTPGLLGGRARGGEPAGHKMRQHADHTRSFTTSSPLHETSEKCLEVIA